MLVRLLTRNAIMAALLCAAQYQKPSENAYTAPLLAATKYPMIK